MTSADLSIRVLRPPGPILVSEVYLGIPTNTDQFGMLGEAVMRGRQPHPQVHPGWLEAVGAFETLAVCLAKLSERRPSETATA